MPVIYPVPIHQIQMRRAPQKNHVFGPRSIQKGRGFEKKTKRSYANSGQPLFSEFLICKNTEQNNAMDRDRLLQTILSTG